MRDGIAAHITGLYHGGHTAEILLRAFAVRVYYHAVGIMAAIMCVGLFTLYMLFCKPCAQSDPRLQDDAKERHARISGVMIIVGFLFGANHMYALARATRHSHDRAQSQARETMGWFWVLDERSALRAMRSHHRMKE